MDRDELIKKFTKQEVETAEEILACVDGPITTDSFRRLLLLFLRGHYSSNENYMGFDHLGCYVWSTDPKTTSLTVEFTHNYDDQNPDSYPGVYVGFGQGTFSKLGIGNRGGLSQDLSGTHVSKEATVNFKISHVAKKASDAFDLADLTARSLLAMGGILAKNAGATGFEVTSMAQPREKKPSPEKYYTVATEVEIKYTLAVTRSQESHRLRSIFQIASSQS